MIWNPPKEEHLLQLQKKYVNVIHCYQLGLIAILKREGTATRRPIPLEQIALTSIFHLFCCFHCRKNNKWKWFVAGYDGNHKWSWMREKEQTLNAQKILIVIGEAAANGHSHGYCWCVDLLVASSMLATSKDICTLRPASSWISNPLLYGHSYMI